MTKIIPVSCNQLMYGIWYAITGCLIFSLVYVEIAHITFHEEQFEQPMLDCRDIGCVEDPKAKVIGSHDCWIDIISMNKQCHSEVIGGYPWENPPPFDMYCVISAMLNLFNGSFLFAKLNEKNGWLKFKSEKKESIT